MFWKKKKIESDEYKELKQQIDLLWLELDVITKRYRRKVMPKGDDAPQETAGSIDDGFDELRQLNKEQKP